MGPRTYTTTSTSPSLSPHPSIQFQIRFRPISPTTPSPARPLHTARHSTNTRNCVCVCDCDGARSRADADADADAEPTRAARIMSARCGADELLGWGAGPLSGARGCGFKGGMREEGGGVNGVGVGVGVKDGWRQLQAPIRGKYGEIWGNGNRSGLWVTAMVGLARWGLHGGVEECGTGWILGFWKVGWPWMVSMICGDVGIEVRMHICIQPYVLYYIRLHHSLHHPHQISIS
ncbi:hypothetical protein EDC01DRAFT_680154 [Geopyxis carbonaria]|nr:hypothetical protein EDC01DRAFT_680154 [Geopyxis carbonaria]